MNDTSSSTNSSTTDLLLALIACLVFFAIISDLATKGMTLDGSLYAAMARNLAQGDGSFWYPASVIAHQSFHDHPPLGLYLQSFFFDALGDHFWVENIYGALTLILSLGLIISILRVTSNRQNTWYSILMFLIAPLSAWSYTNNYLENTLTVFCLLSVASALHALDNNKSSTAQKAGFSALSGIAIVLGLLTKGPVALWPLAIFPLYWITFRESSPRIASLFVVQTSVVFMLTCIILGFTNGSDALAVYWQNQILGSLSGSRGAEFGRLLVGTVLLKNLAGPLVYSSILLLILRTKPNFNRWFTLFLLLGLAASLPLMLSPRQYEHYLLPSLPMFFIALGIAMSDITNRFRDWLTQHTTKLSCIVLVLTITCVVGYQDKFGTVSDDKALLAFVESAREPLHNQTEIQYCLGFNNLRLQAYLFRHLNIKISDNTAAFEACDRKRETSIDPALVAHGVLTLYRVD